MCFPATLSEMVSLVGKLVLVYIIENTNFFSLKKKKLNVILLQQSRHTVKVPCTLHECTVNL